MNISLLTDVSSALKDAITPFLGLIGVYFGYKLSLSKAQRDFKLSKLEDLYQAINLYSHLLERMVADAISTLGDNPSYNSFKERANRLTDSSHFINSEMLSKIYFPALASNFETYSHAIEPIAPTISAAISEANLTKQVTMLNDLLCSISVATTDFNKAIYKEAKTIQSS